jgi:hypothetical protein
MSLPEQNHQQTIELILEISRSEYGRATERLTGLIAEVTDLYAGRWPSHEACDVTYHDFGHALDVTLAVARMVAGWNRTEKEQPLAEDHFHLALAAALFHDSGYIKDRGDHEGSGGKHTLVHVRRSMDIARACLTRHQWRQPEIEAVCGIVSITDYGSSPDPDTVFSDPRHALLGRMVATCDLLAQMADTAYVQRMEDLYAELRDSYEFEQSETLAGKGTRIYRSAEEIRDSTLSFYEQFVVPTLTRLDRMDRYLAAFFGEGRNPYLENITANLALHFPDLGSQWRRLGDVLEDLNLATPTQIRQALERQKLAAGTPPAGREFRILVRERLLPWFMADPGQGHRLGDILLKMGAVNPGTLARGLLAQILPESLCDGLAGGQLLLLLRAAILLQNIDRGPSILGGIMEMLNQTLDCEASSILLADPAEREMLIVLPTGWMKKTVLGRGIALDKGLAGWVYRNGQPAMVNNAAADQRFHGGLDRDTGFVTRSVLAVPLFVRGECIGALEALNTRHDNFSDSDRNLLFLFANLMGNAMVAVCGD